LHKISSHTTMQATQETINEIISHATADIKYPATAPGLYKPLIYTLAGGGKRLRTRVCCSLHLPLLPATAPSKKRSRRRSDLKSSTISRFSTTTSWTTPTSDAADPPCTANGTPAPQSSPATPCSPLPRNISPTAPPINFRPCSAYSTTRPCRYIRDSNSTWSSSTATM